MNKIRKFRKFVVSSICISLVFFQLACTSFVVNNERSLATSQTLVTEYVEFANRNRDTLPNDALMVAEQLRVNGPGYLDSWFVALMAYKHNRTPENKANLETITATVTALLDDASKKIHTQE